MLRQTVLVRGAQVLAQGLTFVFGVEEAALLQNRYNPVDEGVNAVFVDIG